MQAMEPDASSDAILAGELNELLVVFDKISGRNQHVDLKTILRLPELKAQITEGDVAIEDLEGAWLEACAVEGDETIDPVNTSGRYRRSWGVCSELAFEGFVRFLSLCEAKTPLPKGPVCRAATEASPGACSRVAGADIGRDLLVARQRMAGLLRATLTVHERDHGSKKEEGASGGLAPADHGQSPDPDWPRGEALHSAMVRAAVEEGLGHHTPETLKELVRIGVYRVSEKESKSNREQKKAFLGLSLSKKLSHDDLVRTGILREATPGEVALEKASAAQSVRRCLERRPTAKELVDKGIILEGTSREKRVERAFLAGKLKHDLERRRGWDELKQKGIALDMAPGEAHEKYQHAAENISRRLQARPSYEDLHARRIALTPCEEVARRVEIDGIRGMLEEAYRNYRGRQQRGSHLAGDNQINKGIYVRKAPIEGAVERAYLTHSLAHSLAHRPELDRLAQKGIFLQGVQAGELEEAHRNARNTLEGSLSRRPSLSALEDKGYLEPQEAHICRGEGDETLENSEGEATAEKRLIEDTAKTSRGCGGVDQLAHSSSAVEAASVVETLEGEAQDEDGRLASLENGCSAACGGTFQGLDDEYIHEEFDRLRGMGIGLDHALASPMVQRWSSLVVWDRNMLVCLWDGNGPAGSLKDLDGFKEFCRTWERKCSAISAYHPRLHESSFQLNAHLEKTQPGEKSPESRPIARQSLDAVQKASIARPASEELEDKKKHGAKGHGEDEGDELETKNSKRGEALDATMTHDHARWGSHPSQPGEIPRQEVLDQLRGTGLSKRLSLQELTGRGINMIDADARYASLVHKVLQAHRAFKKSSAQLNAVLCEHPPE